MNCPKCTGLLIQEEIQEHSGRFHGWRCIQCGLRLDQTIAQNRHDAQPDARSTAMAGSPSGAGSPLEPRTAGRHKRPTRAR